MKGIWSAPNTFFSWLLLKCVSKKNIIDHYQGVTIVKSGGFIQSITLGRYAISTWINRYHEMGHVEISELLGWGYLIHVYYLIYSVILTIMFNNDIAIYNLIGALFFFGLWYWFNEYLANKWEKIQELL